MAYRYAVGIFAVLAVLITSCNDSNNQTKASESAYNRNIKKAYTSKNMSNADLAWHARNTYAWDCSEVVKKEQKTDKPYFFIECGNGTRLRVYPRPGKHPKITNSDGGFN